MKRKRINMGVIQDSRLKSMIRGGLLMTMMLLSNMIIAQVNISSDCNTGTADLSDIDTQNKPVGSVLTWHNATPVDNDNVINDVSSLSPGTYYASFYDTTDMCFSTNELMVTVTPAFCLQNMCPDTTVDLTTDVSVSSTPPVHSVLSYHTSLPAGASNEIADPSAVEAGTYYVTYRDTINNCYTAGGMGATEIIVNQVSCQTGIDILKSSTVEAGDDNIVNAGDTVFYTFEITNTGAILLTDVAIIDPKITNGTTACPADTLLPGETIYCTANYVLLQKDLDKGIVKNSAVVCALPDYESAGIYNALQTAIKDTSDTANPNDPSETDADGNTDQDSTSTLLPPQPSLDLVKTISRVGDNGDGQTYIGDTIYYAFQAKNTGNVTLTDVMVTDTNAVMVGGNIASLSPGECDSTTLYAYHIIDQDDAAAGYVENSAEATGLPNTLNYFYNEGLVPEVRDVSDTGNPNETPDGSGDMDGNPTNDPTVLNVCAPAITACPMNWNTTFSFNSNTCAIAPSYPNIDQIRMADPSFVAEDCGDMNNISVSFFDHVVPEECNVRGATHFDERTIIRSYVFTNVANAEILDTCTQEITYAITECNQLTNYGTVGINTDYTGTTQLMMAVTDACDVPPIIEDSPVSGSCGYVEYMWIRSTQERSPGIPYSPNAQITGPEGQGYIWEIIEGANSSSYDPGAIATNTYYIRCSRNFGCCAYGESNRVSYIVDNMGSCPVPPAPASKECTDEDISLFGPVDNFIQNEDNNMVTDGEIIASNIIEQDSMVTFDAAGGVRLLSGFEVKPNSALEIYLKGCKD